LKNYLEAEFEKMMIDEDENSFDSDENEEKDASDN